MSLSSECKLPTALRRKTGEVNAVNCQFYPSFDGWTVKGGHLIKTEIERNDNTTFEIF